MKQEQIDRICTWIGWHWRSPGGTAWYDKDGKIVANRSTNKHNFDPSTNPSDCHTVMQEVVKRGEWWYVSKSPFGPGEPYFAGLNPIWTTGWNGRPDYEGHGATESEAKMNAVLAMIEGA